MSRSNPPPLLPHQVKGAEWLTKQFTKKKGQRNSLLLGDAMGTGKTATALTTIKALKAKRILIVCPASARSVWPSEIEKWWSASDVASLSFLPIASKKTIYDFSPSSLVALVSYSLVKEATILKQIILAHRRNPFDVIIYDEAHYLANPKTLQTRACFSNLWEEGEKTGAKFLLLTGSVLGNKIIDTYPLLKKLAPDLFPEGRFQFAKNYCTTARISPWGGLEAKGARNIDDLRDRASSFLLRRELHEVIDNFPDSVERDINLLSLADDISKSGEALLSKSNKALGQWMSESSTASEDMPSKKQNPKVYTLLAKARKASIEGKLELIHSYLKALKKEEKANSSPVCPCVIFFYHTSMLEDIKTTIQSALGLTPQEISVFTGHTSKADRDAAIRDFQVNRKTKVFLCTFAAAEAITLTRAHKLFFLELSWTMAKVEQAIDRIRRIGQEKVTEITFLNATELDKLMLASFRKKLRDKKSLLEGSDKGLI